MNKGARLAGLLAAISYASALAADLPPSAAPTPATSDALSAKVAELDSKIARLEGRIDNRMPTMTGSGAYAKGTTLRIDGNGSESLLERLRRLEREVAAANATAAAKDQTIANLNHELSIAQSTGKQAREQADYLAHTGESLLAAQQTLAERQERIAGLTAQAATSDLQRLRAERRWYALASEILRLTPEDARDLPEIQNRIREATRDVREDVK
jgi:chromosome segregation ATPase